MLDALNISVKSQMLVFSKTSLQKHYIAPETPRAVYFNDEVYLGFVQNGEVLEVASTDPVLGAIFYTISQKKAIKPKITRQTHACLQCHDSGSLTLGNPGHIVRSVYSDTDGMPIFSAGTFHTTQESPFKERWGGWYVTGVHGEQVHMGNTLVKNKDDAEHVDFRKGCNVTNVKDYFDTKKYASPHSDIVALMVAAHQTTMHNLITRAGFDTRLAVWQEREMNKALGEPLERRSASTESRIKSVVEPLLKYMLFSDEAKLSAYVAGTSGYAEEFSRLGPKDNSGRSLREFDLKTRTFKHPCSYLIYSDSFNQLPDDVLALIKSRLTEILSGKDNSKEYAHLSLDDRRNIREILADTWKNAPAEWRK